MQIPLDPKTCQQARLSRDARFDGRFFTAVKTTGIYCRPICPARSPKEENIEYFSHAYLAAKAGYRPCLRCRPDSAPDSPVWNGVDTTLKRAKQLIDDGALEQGSLLELSARLGISDRYLRQLFEKHLGISPKSYALFRQCEFAKNLLHQTALPITEIAFAAGFNSIRRFNDCFKKQLCMSPTQIRQQGKVSNALQLKLYYRPPYNWQHLQTFLQTRLIDGLEWCDAQSYGRSFILDNQQGQCKGQFTATHHQERHCFEVSIEIDNLRLLKTVVNNIRRLLDLDTDIEIVEQCLGKNGLENMSTGIRLPGIWSLFEAGIRAILGQQISVSAAQNLVRTVTHELGESTENGIVYFPSVSRMTASDFSFLKIPRSRKQTLKNLAQYMLDNPTTNNPTDWLMLKGIGPWTVGYAKMRGLSDPDIYLGGDLGVKKALQASSSSAFDPINCAPFRSYLTFQLWNKL